VKQTKPCESQIVLGREEEGEAVVSVWIRK